LPFEDGIVVEAEYRAYSSIPDLLRRVRSKVRFGDNCNMQELGMLRDILLRDVGAEVEIILGEEA
jgi:hypothetical protein